MAMDRRYDIVNGRDEISIEEDLDSDQRMPSTAEEVDRESLKEQIQSKTDKLQSPVWYGLIYSSAWSSLFPRSTFTIADSQQYHRS